jgi:3-oxoacyl-[acyl-carrier-protein] synthase III
VVLGDAAAAAILKETPRGGLLASCLYASERLRGRMNMPLPGTPGARSYHDFDARNHELGESAMVCIGKSVKDALATAQLGIHDMDWVLLHQPNLTLFNALIDMLGVDPARTVPIVREVGSLGAASVAMSLDRLMRTRDVKSGERILFASVGAGTAHGALIYEVP